MFAHNPRQLKQGHLRLAEHCQQLGIGVDVALVGGNERGYSCKALEMARMIAK